MPYEANADLPPRVRHVLPHHAQEIYRAAFNNAWEEYANPEKRYENESREETAHRVAWAAVKTKFAKEDGHWDWKE